MGSFAVEGPVQLSGSVKVSGAKNAALPILAAVPVVKGETILHNVPRLEDVFTMIQILESLGISSKWNGNTLILKNEGLQTNEVPYELVRKMRASFNVLGPITVSTGEARVPQPGGCAIGVRPVNFHIDGLKKMGFSVEVKHGVVDACVTRQPEGPCKTVSLPQPSVGATEHMMTTAAAVEGLEVMITNAAQEPEIVDLQHFLNACGAQIEGAGTSTVIVKGTKELFGCEFSIMNDRIEAGTYLIAGAATKGDVTIDGVEPAHLKALFDVFEHAGVVYEVGDSWVRIVPDGEYRPVHIDVQPYPGFPTDLQPQITTMLSTVEGVSVIREHVFRGRFHHVPELNRMGASISVENGTAVIEGVEKLLGAPVEATDLRAAAALVIAGLMADGRTVISKIEHIFRGYEDILEKFKSMGAQIAYLVDE